MGEDKLFLDVRRSMLKGSYQEALLELQRIEGQELGMTEQSRCKILMSGCLIGKSKYESALELSQQVIELSKNTPGQEIIVVDAIISTAEALWRLGRLDESLEFSEKGEQMIQDLPKAQSKKLTSQKAALLYHKGTANIDKGELELASEYLQQSLSIREAIDTRPANDDSLSNMEIKLQIAESLNNIGDLECCKGELDPALEYFQRSLTLYKELNNKQGMGKLLTNIGDVFALRGELNQALEYCQQSLKLVEELDHKLNVAIILHNTGKLYHEMENLELAKNLLEQSLAFSKETKITPLFTSYNLLHLIRVLIDMDLVNQAEQILQQLHDLSIKSGNAVVNQMYRIADALILRTSTRWKNRAKAEELLEHIINEEILDSELTTLSLINLSNIFLDEYQTSGNKEVLDEVHTHLNRLLDIAKHQNSFWLLAETYVLLSKLALLEGDAENARSMLTQAQITADEKGLRRLAVKISDEHDALLDKLNKWEKLSIKDAPLPERAKLAGIDEQVNRMFHRGLVEPPKLSEEEPILVMLLAAGGICVHSKSFAPVTKVSEHMIAGFLNALQKFSEEVFSQTLDRIRLEAYTVLVRFEEPFTYCYVYKGQSYSAQQKLTRLIELAPQRPSLWNPMLETTQTGRALNSEIQSILDGLLSEVFLTT